MVLQWIKIIQYYPSSSSSSRAAAGRESTNLSVPLYRLSVQNHCRVCIFLLQFFYITMSLYYCNYYFFIQLLLCTISIIFNPGTLLCHVCFPAPSPRKKSTFFSTTKPNEHQYIILQQQSPLPDLQLPPIHPPTQPPTPQTRLI